MHLSRCPVDAGGVPAEWVESAAAFRGQPTLVWFGDSDRPAAERLAEITEARVIVIGPASVTEGAAAWLWLLGEGCDLRTTTFAAAADGGARAFEVLRFVVEHELPRPGGGAMFYSPDTVFFAGEPVTFG